MCGIAGILNMGFHPMADMERKLKAMNHLQRHRGPDGEGMWISEDQSIGFAHCRLKIIDLLSGDQPMKDEAGNWVCYNGEIYNYLELRQEIGGDYRTASDTEVLLKAYQKWGQDCVSHFKGMFSFALWDQQKQTLFCARDRFGIKPFYYYQQGDLFIFASEIKALLPLMDEVKIDTEGLMDYLTFQFCLDGKTLVQNIRECLPAHTITIQRGQLSFRRYWQLQYDLDWDHSEKYFTEKLEQMVSDSVRYHIRSDVPIGGYISGGLDSSVVSALAVEHMQGDYTGFTGKFTDYGGYDESAYALELAGKYGFPVHQMDITSVDFLDSIEKVIYYLDQPAAGPGSFCQYMISSLAAKHRKVVLGGQGGDEIFGGYTRYLVAYFEQCIKGAINGTMQSGNFLVTYESIIPNLINLRNYKPMIKAFWKDGLFDELDKRYFRLVNRAPDIQDCVHWERLGQYDQFETFSQIFNAPNTKKASYFDKMLHFDFKTSLPALLQVDDRMSMAHGIESRVPFLDHDLIEYVATIPANFKLKSGDAKYILKKSMERYLPASILGRTDKMGFPVPFVEWTKGPAKDFVWDMLSSQAALGREYIDNDKALEKINGEPAFGRNIWGLLSLELWQREFLDHAARYRAMV